MTQHSPEPHELAVPASESGSAEPDLITGSVGAAGVDTADAPTGAPDPDSAPDSRGAPGWIVVTVATLVVATTAIAEVLVQEAISAWTGMALVAMAVIAPLLTRAGDRSLPAMMPPLAFLAAVLIAGQALVEPEGGSWQARQALMIGETLGANAAWVVAATALSVTIATVRHIADRRRARSSSSS